MAQAPGTVTSTSTSSVTATTATVSCVLTNTIPSLPSGIHAVCKIGSATVLTMDIVIAQGSNGSVGAFVNGSDNVTWIVNQAAGTTVITWQIAANGVAKSGTF